MHRKGFVRTTISTLALIRFVTATTTTTTFIIIIVSIHLRMIRCFHILPLVRTMSTIIATTYTTFQMCRTSKACKARGGIDIGHVSHRTGTFVQFFDIHFGRRCRCRCRRRGRRGDIRIVVTTTTTLDCCVCCWCRCGRHCSWTGMGCRPIRWSITKWIVRMTRIDRRRCRRTQQQ